jgi:uncharacterized membrane protein YfcA
MAAYATVCLAALFASALTLFSGFGLGTLLLPAFALFFPVEVAVAATAIVHLLNNLFKLGLVGRFADRRIVLAFGLPAIPAAALGAWLLSLLGGLAPLGEWSAGGRTFTITAVKLVVAALVAGFATLELRSAEVLPALPPSFLPLGGVLSGLFGGLSGHQGALRSAFLMKAGLSKRAFIGSGVACAVLVDLARIGVYGGAFLTEPFAALGRENAHGLVAAATLCAFAGAWTGSRMASAVTLDAVRRLVGALLVLTGLALAAGLV